MTPETLAALARQRQIVDRMLATITDDVLSAWLRAWYDIEHELLRTDLSPLLDTRERRRQLARTQKQSAQRILQASTETNGVLTQNARVMIERALIEQPELIATQLPPGVSASLLRPPTETVERMVRRSTEQITARSYWLSVESTEAMNRALNLGASAGDNPRDVAERMIENARDVFNGGIARAQVIARTELGDVHRQASEASQKANEEVLEGWVWFAQLGPRTCASCIAQHGQVHPLDEPGPLDHHQGRCTRLPRTKTWEELGFDGIPETRPPVESGLDWFNRQPEHVQREVLGPARFNAWKAGAYPPDAWSVRRSTEGWRDSFHVGKLPPGDWRTGAPLAPKGIDWDALMTGPDIGQELNRMMVDRGVGAVVASGFDIDGLSIEQLRVAGRTIEKLTEAYPEVQFDLLIEPMRGRSVAQAWGMHYKKGYMRLNSNYLKDVSGSAVDLAHQRKTFWWSLRPEVPDVTDFEYVVAHEFGHLLDYKSGNLGTRGGISPKRIRNRVGRDAGLKPRTPEWDEFLKHEISVYGQRDATEAIAEAFADTWINGEFASETNKRTVAALIAKLRGGI